MTVTDDGFEGSRRDQRTSTSPILGSRSLPPLVMDQQAFAVNRTACRAVFFLNFGGAIFGPSRVPFLDVKKLLYAVSRSRRDCWSTTTDTSPSQAQLRSLLGLGDDPLRQLGRRRARQTLPIGVTTQSKGVAPDDAGAPERPRQTGSPRSARVHTYVVPELHADHRTGARSTHRPKDHIQPKPCAL